MVTAHLRKADVPTQDEITTMVSRHEEQTETLRARMEADYDRLQLWEPADGRDEEGYRTYVSNGPMTFLDKMASWIVGADLKIRMHYGRAQMIERKRMDSAERFYYGILRAADERLERMMQLPLREQLAWFILARGYYAGRALLVKDEEDQSTYVDISPWDPLHIFWGVGRRGLLWVCHRTKKTASEIEDEYGLTVDGQNVLASPSTNGHTPYAGGTWEEGIDVYDWYNENINCVVINNEWAKEPEPHGCDRVPAFLGAVGPSPLIQRRTMAQRDTIADYGDSILKANRNIQDKSNFLMSTMLHLAALARNRAHTLSSRDGSKTLDENPYTEGAEVPLAEGEKLELLPLLETGRDLAAMAALATGELQRGALPFVAYGELANPISGYAIKLLTQGIDAPLSPRVKAITLAYRQICGLIYDQYTTGSYGDMELSGIDRNRKWFEATITPQEIIGVGTPEIKLVVRVPQDDQAKFQMAQLAREGPTPLLPDIFLYDEVLEVEDADLIADQINEQMGKNMLPAAKLFEIGKAMLERGDTELAHMYGFAAAAEMVRMGLTMNSGTSGPNGANPPAPGSNPGYSPETLPPGGAQGTPPQTPPGQQGPLVPPGSPRPGAQRGLLREGFNIP